NRLAVVGLGIIGFFIVFCWVGPLVYHTNQIQTDLAAASQSPSLTHLLGTDNVGYDTLGRLMEGGQTSLEVGVAASLLGTSLGVVWGAVAGFVGGLVDAVMMRVVDALLAIPALFLLLFLASVITPSLTLMIFIIAFVSWLVPARLVRAETLTLRERDYVQAVRMMGGTSVRTIMRHIVPNTVGTIVVNATFQVADAILILAYLSYLGLGVPPPAANWGEMLSGGVNYVFAGYWWLIWPVGLCIVASVVAFNFVGDALRDAVDVRLQRR
ncbi:MAG: ABC transporter permease, partial [Candidatus Dormibacteria bacterium]